MSTKLLLTTTALSVILVGCGSNDSKENEVPQTTIATTQTVTTTTQTVAQQISVDQADDKHVESFEIFANVYKEEVEDTRNFVESKDLKIGPQFEEHYKIFADTVDAQVRAIETGDRKLGQIREKSKNDYDKALEDFTKETDNAEKKIVDAYNKFVRDLGSDLNGEKEKVFKKDEWTKFWKDTKDTIDIKIDTERKEKGL